MYYTYLTYGVNSMFDFVWFKYCEEILIPERKSYYCVCET